MAWTQTDLDALEAAIAGGTRDVQIQGKRVVYRNLDEMITIRNLIRRELGQIPSFATVTPTYSSGLNASSRPEGSETRF